MEIKGLTYPSGSKEDYLKELFNHKDSDFELQFGTAHLKKGMRTPFEGDFTKHDQAKIVLILEGKVQLTLENNPQELILNPGDSFKVEPFEGHSGLVLKDLKLIYVLFGTKQKAQQ
ncbi:hypothetical protein ACS386_07810 [Flavobacteriaceae bacterium LMO-SS05]